MKAVIQIIQASALSMFETLHRYAYLENSLIPTPSTSQGINIYIHHEEKTFRMEIVTLIL